MTILVLLATLCSTSTTHAASPIFKITVSEGWALTLEKDPKLLPGSARVALAIIIPLGDGISIAVKPRIRIPHTEFAPQPGLIIGMGFRITDSLTWLVGVLYEPLINYDDGTMRHLISPGTGPSIAITDGISISASVAAGCTAADGVCSFAFTPVEIAFTLP